MTTKLTLISSILAPLALAGAPALAQDYTSDDPAAYQVEDVMPDAGAPSLAVTLGSDGDELAMADAEIDHRIDLRVGDGALTGQEADTVRADLDAIRADAAETLNENGRLTGQDRAQISERLADLKDELDDLADNPDVVPTD